MRLLCPNIVRCGGTRARLFTVVTRSGVAAVSPWSESNSLSCAALAQVAEVYCPPYVCQCVSFSCGCGMSPAGTQGREILFYFKNDHFKGDAAAMRLLSCCEEPNRDNMHSLLLCDS